MSVKQERLESLKKELEAAREESPWAWFAPHLARGAVFLVRADLELLEVAAHIAADSVEQVSGWLSNGGLAKPTPAQVEAWDGTPDRRFRFVIVQPYVLIQPLDH